MKRVKHPRMFALKIGRMVDAMTFIVVSYILVEGLAAIFNAQSYYNEVRRVMHGGSVTAKEILVMNMLQNSRHVAMLMDLAVCFGLAGLLIVLAYYTRRVIGLAAVAASMSIGIIASVALYGAVVVPFARGILDFFIPGAYSSAENMVAGLFEGAFVFQAPFVVCLAMLPMPVAIICRMIWAYRNGDRDRLDLVNSI